jgi:hypothetical protein
MFIMCSLDSGLCEELIAHSELSYRARARVRLIVIQKHQQ